MPIDRRITNGLAWAGALIVVAVPAADVALRQFEPQTDPKIALVETQPEPEAPILPTPLSQRPPNVAKPVTAPIKPVEPVATAAVPEDAIEADPVVTANTGRQAAGDDVVSSYLQAGRPLPSYISGVAGAAVTPEPAVEPDVAAPEDEGDVESVATVSRAQQVSFPTPVSQRPASVQRPQVAAQPPLVIDTPAPITTDADLADWESGPLSDFLARRQGGSGQVTPDYDPDGFFLDQGPNSRNRAQRFPRAYEDEYYPFE
ncbi:hypothetical protein [Devosia sp. CAU 1758]